MFRGQVMQLIEKLSSEVLKKTFIVAKFHTKLIQRVERKSWNPTEWVTPQLTAIGGKGRKLNGLPKLQRVLRSQVHKKNTTLRRIQHPPQALGSINTWLLQQKVTPF